MPPSPPSPTRSPRRSPGRNPLNERSQSRNNTESLRLVKDDQNANTGVASKTPFPTKPAHILRPAPGRGQGLSFAEGGSVSDDHLPERLVQHINKNKGKGRAGSNASSRPTTAETRTLSLKKSVKALRDEFESHTSSSSHASTPSAPASPWLLSPEIGPSAARSLHSIPSLSALTRTPFDLPANLATDEPVVATISHRRYKSEESLPTIPASPRTSRESSRHSQDSQRPTTPDLPHYSQDSSSPNVIRLGGPSSPYPDLYSSSSPFRETDLSSPNVVRLGEPSSPPHPQPSQPTFSLSQDAAPASSSPDVIRLRRSSSPPAFRRLVDVTSRSSTPSLRELGESSSPNVVQIGSSSSPITDYRQERSDSIHSDGSEDSVGTVKRKHEARAQPSYSTFPTSATRFSSSPPTQSLNNYSSFDSSEDPAETLRTNSVDSREVLESSPAPSIQYPVVRAPAPSTYAEIHVPKRIARPDMPSSLASGEWHPHRLSAIASEWSAERQESTRRMTDEYSSGRRYTDEYSNRRYTDEYSSRRLTDEYDSRLTTDDFAAYENDGLPDLPHPAYLIGQPISSGAISGSDDLYEASDNLSELRSGSFSIHGKPSGFFTVVSSSNSNSNSTSNGNSSGSRKGSLGSVSRSLRRVDSNSSLRQSLPAWARRYYSHGGSATNLGVFNHRLSHASSRGQLSSSGGSSRPATGSSSPAPDTVPGSLWRPRTRRRRPSEFESTPEENEEDLETLTTEGQRRDSRKGRSRKPRPKSLPLDPKDPRSHWAEAEEEALQRDIDELARRLRQSRIASEWSPHLFQDSRVEKQGRGYRSRWKAPSLEDASSAEAPTGRRNRQVWLFALGFVFPPAWLLAAILPLPQRVSGYDGPGSHRQDIRGSYARLSRDELEQQIRFEQKLATAEEIWWENARWWRSLNRCMCFVGVAIIAVVVSEID